MSRVAFYTFGILIPIPILPPEGFLAAGEINFKTAETTAGYVNHASVMSWDVDKLVWEQNWGVWGKFIAPRFFLKQENDDGQRVAQTLSLWTGIESVYKFAYTGPHAESLRRRKEWFQKAEWPSYAIWWVNDQHIPTWSEACERLEYLYDNGSSSFAFDFKKPFDEQGQPTQLKQPTE